jgi:hypothetical protein
MNEEGAERPLLLPAELPAQLAADHRLALAANPDVSIRPDEQALRVAGHLAPWLTM